MVQIYNLDINQAEQICFFKLTWGDGMQLTAQMPYPEELIKIYQRWQQAYYNYYRALPKIDEAAEPVDALSSLRGRTVAMGQVSIDQTNLRRQLTQAEVRLMENFDSWLGRHELRSIRGQLNQRSERTQSEVTLYITCAEIALRRLPWETWELTQGFVQGAKIRIARQPANIPVAANPPKKQRRKARALVIIGDDTGLDFRKDLKAMERLNKLVAPTVVGWKTDQDSNNLKDRDKLITKVRGEIRDPDGWDMLLFFGHSNEAADLGGEIAIAPKTTISIRDLESDLTEAKRNGLQFALFNSCKGLDIADRLVSLGLNQVVIMREPIHNQVAQYFLLQFLQRLAEYDDVHTALQKTTKELKFDKAMAYPSTYLVPSLFSHPGAELFQLHPVGWKGKLAQLWPSRRQGMALAAIAALSLLPPVRDSLMAGRLWTQAITRHVTTRPLQAEVSPPVLLVHVDDASITDQSYEGDADRINRDYLARLLDRLVTLDVTVLGVDYILDQKQEDNDARLAQSVQKAVQEEMWIVFASELKNGQELGPQAPVFNPYWSMQGYVNAPPWYLEALQTTQYCDTRCPFSYLLASTYAAIHSTSNLNLNLSLTRTSELHKDLFNSIARTNDDRFLKNLFRYRLPLITSLSRWIYQRWFHPILDFSIPLEHVFVRISAQELLNRDITALRTQYNWKKQVVLIGASDYYRATPDRWLDYVPNPPAIQFWRDRVQDPNNNFTGAEGHAYTIHHFLNRHIVTPVPHLWMALVGMGVGASSARFLQQHKTLRQHRWIALVMFSIGYGLFGLVIYGLASIVLPWLLPTSAVWVYHIPSLKSSNQERKS